jgi:hypothetical protein
MYENQYGREDPREFLRDKSQDELQFIEDKMERCTKCGEYRPKSKLKYGECYMCRNGIKGYEE